MTRQQLQSVLKSIRESGTELQVKLNSSTEALQGEYDRLNDTVEPEDDDAIVAPDCDFDGQPCSDDPLTHEDLLTQLAIEDPEQFAKNAERVKQLQTEPLLSYSDRQYSWVDVNKSETATSLEILEEPEMITTAPSVRTPLYRFANNCGDFRDTWLELDPQRLADGHHRVWQIAQYPNGSSKTKGIWCEICELPDVTLDSAWELCKADFHQRYTKKQERMEESYRICFGNTCEVKELPVLPDDLIGYLVVSPETTAFKLPPCTYKVHSALPNLNGKGDGYFTLHDVSTGYITHVGQNQLIKWLKIGYWKYQ